MTQLGSGQVRLSLPRDFVGQLLEGLDLLVDQWDNTAEFMAHGVSRDDVAIRECNDANEAKFIRDYYQLIQRRIEEQLMP